MANYYDFSSNDYYLARAEERIKRAWDFSVNYFGIPIPKNALYGRDKHMYFYVDDYQQFNNPKRSVFYIHVLNADKMSGFTYGSIYKKNALYKMIMAMIDRHDLWDVKCEKQLMLSKSYKPNLRRPSNPDGKPNPRQFLDSKAAEYGRGITEKDAVYTPYIPSSHDIEKNARDYEKNVRFSNVKLNQRYSPEALERIIAARAKFNSSKK